MKFVLIYDDLENINNHHSIINSINTNEIYIIYNQSLKRLNFEETITNLHKNKSREFSRFVFSFFLSLFPCVSVSLVYRQQAQQQL